ncbi:MAG: hypothetical protein HN458_05105 [Euryarchaeota archaeon]|jgi:hypothetical protein|nr:hypothetical protein [Euryarchaeota archaeon]
MTDDILADSPLGLGSSQELINGLEADEHRHELAERLIRRLSVKDHNAIYEMISAKAYFGGILIAILALFYWIFISSADDSLDTGVSILGTLSFPDVAIAVMALGLLSALFRDYSRELGHLFPSLVSGVMIIVCGFYAVEPLVYGFVSNDLEAQTALWRSARLGLLWGGVTYCAHYLVDAFLLYWLKQFCANHDINISSVEESVAHEHLSAD